MAKNFLPWNAHVREDRHELFCAFWVLSKKIVRSGMRTATYCEVSNRLEALARNFTSWKSRVRLSFHRVYQIRKQCAVINEKAGDMVPNEVLVPALSIKFGRKSVSIPPSISTTYSGNHNRETSESIAGSIGFKPTC